LASHSTGPTPPVQRPPVAEASRPGPGNSLAAQPLPSGRQLVTANASAQDLAVLGERVPFDWRRVELRQDKQDWKLVAGSYALANFGGHQDDARRALTALQFYRFTEQHWIGPPAASALTYFLVNGQPPRGLVFGVN